MGSAGIGADDYTEIADAGIGHRGIADSDEPSRHKRNFFSATETWAVSRSENRFLKLRTLTPKKSMGNGTQRHSRSHPGTLLFAQPTALRIIYETF